jgi:hypothetical protein
MMIAGPDDGARQDANEWRMGGEQMLANSTTRQCGTGTIELGEMRCEAWMSFLTIRRDDQLEYRMRNFPRTQDD